MGRSDDKVFVKGNVVQKLHAHCSVVNVVTIVCKSVGYYKYKVRVAPGCSSGLA